jgi:hypothetical protein
VTDHSSKEHTTFLGSAIFLRRTQRHFLKNVTESDLKVCNDGSLVQILRFWTLSIVSSLSKDPVLFIFQEIGTSSIDWTQLSRFLPEDGDTIQFPKRCVLKCKQEDILNKDKMMDNVQKRRANICNRIILT